MVEKNELEEYLQEYADSNSLQSLVEFLKDQLIEALDDHPSDTENQKHNLNILVRELEKDLDWIENRKLAEFDPERQ